MIRKIIRIDEEKCSGCGICAGACHEGAIGIVDGKAKLLWEECCDGLGDCLPACPEGAITFEEREAPAYRKEAVQELKLRKTVKNLPHGCPGAGARVSFRKNAENALSQWPVQIKLVPVKAPFFDGAHVLVAADCTAYAYGSFHRDFIRNRIALIGCPKLDSVDYSVKLTQIFAENEVRSVTVVRMEVPCCGGIENAVKRALQASGKAIPWSVVTLSADGRIVE